MIVRSPEAASRACSRTRLPALATPWSPIWCAGDVAARPWPQAYPKPTKIDRGLRRPGHVTPAWQRYLTDRSFRRNFTTLGGDGNGTLNPLIEAPESYCPHPYLVAVSMVERQQRNPDGTWTLIGAHERHGRCARAGGPARRALRRRRPGGRPVAVPWSLGDPDQGCSIILHNYTYSDPRHVPSSFSCPPLCYRVYSPPNHHATRDAFARLPPRVPSTDFGTRHGPGCCSSRDCETVALCPHSFDPCRW